MKPHPVGARLLVRPHEAPKERNGIVIPETSQERAQSGDVVEVGPASMLPDPVKEGSIVIFRHQAGSDLELDGVRHFLLEENELLAYLS